MTLQERKNELLAIMRKTQSRFVMQIESAFNVKGGGTVLSGWLLGHVRAGSSVGCLMDAAARQMLTEDFEVLGLERYKKIEEKLDAWEEPIGCGILVQQLANPAQLAGKLFCGGYRVPQSPELTALGSVLADCQRANGARFALQIQDVFELGNGETGLVGYLRGTVLAGKSLARLCARPGGRALSEGVRVKSLLYRRREEKALVSDHAVLPCGIVITGTFDPEMLRGEMLIEWSKMM